MAAKLILTAFIAALRVNGSPCKPNSSAPTSPDFTSDAVFTTITADDVSTGPGFPTQSSIYGFTSTALASSRAIDEAITDSTTILTLEASSSDTSSPETLASETTWDRSSASAIPTSLMTTDSTVDESTTVDSAVVTSWSSGPTTSSSITSTTTTAEAQTPIGFHNGGFEDDPSPDALPWVIGRSVTIPNDPENAHSGNRYALVKFPITGTGRPIYPLQQSITGLDATKTYLLTIHWAFTDFGSLSNTACEFWTYFGPLIEYYKFNAAGMPTNEYSRRQYLAAVSTVSDNANMILYWRCSNSVPSSPWAGVEIRIDDVSLVEYDPPCTLVEPPPQGLVCGQTGTFPTSANSYLIGSEIPLGPFENCAQMCAENPECKTITGALGNGNVIGRNARCKLYSKTPEELGFYASTSGPGVFQPGCFKCRPSE
ncbi:hypothetical protein FVEN_g4562 [Fusarium venenatum]|uniref:Apple domain-containing protein n=1 Tax=Fusarium venenatum TaxID=56646 RepID=A0A2L2TMX3_9HYPO|nr:uncharacterized protein FVRRES_02539 [Fusarium venenatum]KAG8357651.1 hypothetical protein FVEN_g4562 [Fusarium venenatum]KAH7004364.1 hypothetical protein EDB82DRAFT_532694 [Fusarium venenatum]CEI66027.1 unnamed protein product [Fusarium venenatum]